MGAVEFCPRNGRIIIVIPTNDDLACVIAGWTTKEFHDYRADIEGNYLKTLELVPNLADRVRHGKREERFVGTADLPNFFRKPYGPGWALVGDSGYHKDPITAQGITDAFRDAELLANAIDEGFSERRPLDEALASLPNCEQFCCRQETVALVAHSWHGGGVLSSAVMTDRTLVQDAR